MDDDTARREAQRRQLVDSIIKLLGDEPSLEPIEGLEVYQQRSDVECDPAVTEPTFRAIAQGRQEILCGEERYEYGPGTYLLSSVELPISAQYLEATEDEPFLGLTLDLAPSLVSSVMVEAGYPRDGEEASVRGIDVHQFDADLMDALLRLVRVADAPEEEAAFLAPMIRREIVFRLLKGDQGARLRQIAVLGDRKHGIVEAIEKIREHYDRQLVIDELAREFGMSTSSFHRHFKDVTAMTPLQYQKKLRLQNARRLMLAEHLDASTAGFEVGYNSASHFSREYKRMFGRPPMEDIERLRQEAE